MTPPLPPHLRTALDRELVTGERAMWSASPRAARLKGGFGIWLFAIPWTVFALGWESAAMLPWFAKGTPDAIRIGAGIVMPLFGLPFIAVGLWMLWQPIRAMRRAGHTVYALTDRRLIRLVIGRATETVSVFTDRIGPVERTERSDGWGTIRVQTHSKVDSEGDRTTERFEMIGIPDVARVHRLLMERQ